MKTSVETRARAVFVLFLLLCTAVGFAWYLVVSGRFTTFEIRTRDPVSGLIVDAPVEYHGVEVGKVKRVELTGSRSVSVLLSVRKEAPITTATVATITSRGLATRGFTGYVYVSLDDAGSDARPLVTPPGRRILGMPSTLTCVPWCRAGRNPADHATGRPVSPALRTMKPGRFSFSLPSP